MRHFRRLGGLLLLLLSPLGPALAQGPLLPADPDILRYPLLKPEAQPAGEVTLLFSDSPETPGQGGVLYRDRVAGRVRVLAYHANGLGRTARLFVVARNPGEAPAEITPLGQGSAVTPGPDAVIGQQTLLRYFASAPRPPRPLAPGETAVLFDSGPLPPEAVVSLMLDLDLSGPLEISTVILAGGERPTPPVLAALPALPRDGRHQRGTFVGADRRLRVPVTAVPSRLVLGGGSDAPLRGTDALTGDPQTLQGNYGVRYELEVEGASGTRLALSPRGGLYQGALWLRDGQRGTPLLIGRGAALTDPARPASLWRVRTGRLGVIFFPGNGSNLPVALIFYPGRPPISARSSP